MPTLTETTRFKTFEIRYVICEYNGEFDYADNSGKSARPGDPVPRPCNTEERSKMKTAYYLYIFDTY